MNRIQRNLLVCLGAAGLALALAACPKKLPEMQVLEARSKYILELAGFLINELEQQANASPTGAEAAGEETAIAAASMMAESAVAAEAAAAEEEAAEGENLDEETMEPAGPRSVEVLFDLLVRFEGKGEALPGITVEVVQNDPFQKEKGRHLTWIETPGLRKGEQRQVSVALEVDNYADGDQFSVEWNPVVPPEKRGEYSEFAESAP